ncbi:MAG TPA: hypothetical protein PLO67_15290 [Saprospiraceae bacterium]|nr:hypothetical protein [Saprospiraceae bacterium]HPI06243.1 hypothetical protein [Saprospiraceae bacterium]
MSKKLFLFSALLFGMTIALVPACNGDKCPDTCGNGICLEDGACDCDPGYEYDADGICNTEVRAKLIGTLTTSEQCSTDPNAFPYSITIANNSSDVASFNIFNFYNSFTSAPVKATLTSATEFTIALQTPVSGGDLEVSGSGSIGTASGGKAQVTITYTVHDKTGANPDAVCTGTVFVKN